jgi:hypothetical protein
MKYTTKPSIVEATQWFKDGDHPLVQGANPKALCGCIMLGGPGSSPHVHDKGTQIGSTLVFAGDWIVTEGDIVCVMSNQKFRETYTELKDQP